MDNTNTVIKDEKSNIADMFTFAVQRMIVMIGDACHLRVHFYTPCTVCVDRTHGAKFGHSNECPSGIEY